MVILYTSHFCDEKKTYMSNEADARAHCVIGIALFLPQSQVRYQTNPGHGRHGHGADAAAVSPFLYFFLSLLRADCRVYIVWLASSFVRAENARHAARSPSLPPAFQFQPRSQNIIRPSVHPHIHARLDSTRSAVQSICIPGFEIGGVRVGEPGGREARNNNFL